MFQHLIKLFLLLCILSCKNVKNHQDMVTKSLDSQKDNNGKYIELDENSTLELFNDIKENNLEKVQQRLTDNVNPNITYKNNYLLQYALRFHNLEVLKLILENNLNYICVDLDHVELKINFKTLTYLLNNYTDKIFYHKRNNRVSMLDILIHLYILEEDQKNQNIYKYIINKHRNTLVCYHYKHVIFEPIK